MVSLILRNCLICYDISNNKTRREIVKLLSDYGKRIQESVFLCSLPLDRVKLLENDLRIFYARKKHAPKSGKQGKKLLTSSTEAANVNNVLDIIMLTMEPNVVNTALVLGTPIDSNRTFAVI